MRRFGVRSCGLTAAVAACAVFGPDLRAGGTIDTTGASIATGAAPAQGTVVEDAAADLGAIPSIDDVTFDGDDGEFVSDRPADGVGQEHAFRGLGGPAFHARADLTLGAGPHDYGNFTVDEGVTVTLAPGAEVRVAGTARIDGRIEMSDGAVAFDCGGDLTVTGHDAPVTSGIAPASALQDALGCRVHVQGRLIVTAVAGARAEMSATVGIHGTDPANLERVTTAGLAVASLADVVIDDIVGPQIDFDAMRRVDVDIANAVVGQLNLAIGGAATLTHVTLRDLNVHAPTGSLHVAGNSSIGREDGAATGWFNVAAHGDVTVDDSVDVRPRHFGAHSFRGRLVLGAGVQADLRGLTDVFGHPGAVVLDGWDGVELGGSVHGDATVTMRSARGDVVLRDGAAIGAAGAVTLHAQGAVTAAGGSVTLDGGSFDVRCVTGDLDLDVASLRSRTGGIVALSNGTVRLRGLIRSARDVQVLSRRDAIDVASADVRTDDTTDEPSGFVRAATYASDASIDASAAHLATGASDAQSGDVLLQIAAEGGVRGKAGLRVTGADARRTPSGVVTRIRGSLAATRGRVDLRGAGRITAGAVSQRVFLDGRGAKLRASAGAIDVAISGASSHHASFVITLREPAAQPGETTPLAFDRAGLHTRTTFRRPRIR